MSEPPNILQLRKKTDSGTAEQTVKYGYDGYQQVFSTPAPLLDVTHEIEIFWLHD